MLRFFRVLVLTMLGLQTAAAADSLPAPLPQPDPGLAAATFAGGCFWCVESVFDKVEGVERTISGYTGGDKDYPNSREVARGNTGHAEAVRVIYDPERVSYAKLLDVFWHNIDPTVQNRQFCDSGSEYRAAIFHHTDRQRRLAEQTRDRIEASGILSAPVVTPIEPVSAFWPADEYHQDYHRKNPVRYKFYANACGRADRLEELWGERAGKS